MTSWSAVARVRALFSGGQPFQAQWCQMVTLQSVQSHTGLTHHFYFFDVWALWRSGLSAKVPKCQKIKNGGLHQYGRKQFEVKPFDTIGLIQLYN